MLISANTSGPLLRFIPSVRLVPEDPGCLRHQETPEQETETTEERETFKTKLN